MKTFVDILMQPFSSNTHAKVNIYLHFFQAILRNVSPKMSIRHKEKCFSMYRKQCKGPVTLLRIKETYELRMKIHKIIFMRTKFS